MSPSGLAVSLLPMASSQRVLSPALGFLCLMSRLDIYDEGYVSPSSVQLVHSWKGERGGDGCISLWPASCDFPLSGLNRETRVHAELAKSCKLADPLCSVEREPLRSKMPPLGHLALNMACCPLCFAACPLRPGVTPPGTLLLFLMDVGINSSGLWSRGGGGG